MAAQDPETVPPEPTQPYYRALTTTWRKTKDAWRALREYPVLSTVLPLTEDVCAWTLDQTGQ
jgi:hypothetical protein